jgi:hypothetical protein
MDFTKLIKGQRYLFHQNVGGVITKFRANFISGNNTLMVKLYEDENNSISESLWSIPLEWIVDVELVGKILDNKCILPEDILLIIDSYV